ncbi:hypothetical protein UM582_09955 [Staphylococcus aureus]|nr:hypothetical protein UM582_09955 [Staphylococcus aureus]
MVLIYYAPQTFLDEKGQRVLIGWMGLPEIEYPTDNEGWAHCLTIPRVLNVENGQLSNVHIQRWKNYVTIKRQH